MKVRLHGVITNHPINFDCSEQGVSMHDLGVMPERLAAYLEEAGAILDGGSTEVWESPDLGEDAEQLRWFPNPTEVTV